MVMAKSIGSINKRRNGLVRIPLMSCPRLNGAMSIGDWYRSSLVSFLILAALRLRRMGAYVSGSVKAVRRKHTPEKMVQTQKSQRQFVPLT